MGFSVEPLDYAPAFAEIFRQGDIKGCSCVKKDVIHTMLPAFTFVAFDECCQGLTIR